MKLHLGCSDDFKPGYLNVDVCEPPAWATEDNFKRVDLRNGSVWREGQAAWIPFKDWRGGWMWPWEDSTVEEIIAHDVFEHIEQLPNYSGNAGMIWTFNESWRILKPGGILDLVVPCWPGIAPFCDPTHKVVYTQDTRYYFDERWNNPQGERGRLGAAYGIRAVFKTLPGTKSGVDWRPVNYAPGTDRHKLFLRLEAVK